MRSLSLNLFWRTAFVAGLALVLAGCGGGGSSAKPSGDVSGEVTFEGKPVQAGVVNFESAASGAAAQAPIKDGSFNFANPVPVGQYKVTIAPPPEAPPVPGETRPPVNPKDIPAKYRTPAKSDLKAEVAAGQNKVKFELKP